MTEKPLKKARKKGGAGSFLKPPAIMKKILSNCQLSVLHLIVIV